MPENVPLANSFTPVLQDLDIQTSTGQSIADKLAGSRNVEKNHGEKSYIFEWKIFWTHAFIYIYIYNIYIYIYIYLGLYIYIIYMYIYT